jgi:hypothetical protein
MRTWQPPRHPAACHVGCFGTAVGVRVSIPGPKGKGAGVQNAGEELPLVAALSRPLGVVSRALSVLLTSSPLRFKIPSTALVLRFRMKSNPHDIWHLAQKITIFTGSGAFEGIYHSQNRDFFTIQFQGQPRSFNWNIIESIAIESGCWPGLGQR